MSLYGHAPMFLLGIRSSFWPRSNAASSDAARLLPPRQFMIGAPSRASRKFPSDFPEFPSDSAPVSPSVDGLPRKQNTDIRAHLESRRRIPALSGFRVP